MLKKVNTEFYLNAFIIYRYLCILITIILYGTLKD